MTLIFATNRPALALASRSVTRARSGRRPTARGSLGPNPQSMVASREANFGRIEDDPALDPIRNDPDFVEMMKGAHPERRYAAVWSDDSRFESQVVECADPAEQRRRTRELIDQNYRPVAWSISRISSDQSLSTVSVWHRPVVSEEKKDELAERQARRQ